MNDKIRLAGGISLVAALGAAGFEGIKFGVKKGKSLWKNHKAKKESKVDEEK